LVFYGKSARIFINNKLMLTINKPVVTCIGSAVLDMTFYTKQGRIIKTPENPTEKQVYAFEYGAKIVSNKLYNTFGGGGLNSAATFSNLGIKPIVLSMVGKDAAGLEMHKWLRQQKITDSLLFFHPSLHTATSFVVTAEADKEAEHVTYYYPGAKQGLVVNRALSQKISSVWVYLASLSGTRWQSSIDAIFSQTAKRSIKVAWNPGADELKGGYKILKRYLPLTEVLLLNLDEATELILSAGDKTVPANPRLVIKRLYEFGQNVSVITNGSKGAYVYDGKSLLYKSALKVKKVINTNGAGDAFGSGFVAGIIIFKYNLSRALALAVHNSGSVVTQIGAQKGILTYKQIKKINL